MRVLCINGGKIPCINDKSQNRLILTDDHSKKMPDNPATYEKLEMDEIDIWKDVIDIIADYIPQPEKTIFDVLKEKYKIKPND